MEGWPHLCRLEHSTKIGRFGHLFLSPLENDDERWFTDRVDISIFHEELFFTFYTYLYQSPTPAIIISNRSRQVPFSYLPLVGLRLKNSSISSSVLPFVSGRNATAVTK